MNIDFWFLGFLHGVQGACPEDVSGAAVGSIFTGHKRLPKRRREIHLAHRAITLNPKINREIFVLGALNILYESK